jgi:outer membrane receptor protein involved in Fe transport
VGQLLHPGAGLVFDGDVSWSRARFVDNSYVPEAVGTVVSAGGTIEDVHHGFGSLRWRYFGPRVLVADGSVQSTSLVEFEAGYKFRKNVRLALDIFNLFNVTADDVDYYYVSRLPGEPAVGVADLMLHPVLPRTARINVRIGL